MQFASGRNSKALLEYIVSEQTWMQNMHDSDQKHWLDKLEVTGPIKGIMDFVDELSHNYDRRLAALHVEYQKDIEEVLACYKAEKQEFSTQINELKAINSALEAELKALQQGYKTLSIEYKLTKDSLETSRNELSQLTQALKSEEEFFELTKQRIKVANEQIRMELEARSVEIADPTAEFKLEVADLNSETAELQESETTLVKPRKLRFNKTRQFFRQVVADRLTRPIILRPKKDPIVTDKFDESDSF